MNLRVKCVLGVAGVSIIFSILFAMLFPFSLKTYSPHFSINFFIGMGLSSLIFIGMGFAGSTERLLFGLRRGTEIVDHTEDAFYAIGTLFLIISIWVSL